MISVLEFLTNELLTELPQSLCIDLASCPRINFFLIPICNSTIAQKSPIMFRNLSIEGSKNMRCYALVRVLNMQRG
jgi:hypothetical protein